MVRFLTLSLLLGAASAFAPASTKTKDSALSAKAPTKEVGALEPLGFFE
jgi:hypothetical protein